jgi:site-specific recombinase XerC
MLSKNVNPITLQEILGHESLAMISQVYQHLNISHQSNAVRDALA